MPSIDWFCFVSFCEQREVRRNSSIELDFNLSRGEKRSGSSLPVILKDRERERERERERDREREGGRERESRRRGAKKSAGKDKGGKNSTFPFPLLSSTSSSQPSSLFFIPLSPSPPPLSRRFWPSVLALFFVVYIVTFPLSCKITPRIRSVFSWCMPGGDGRGKAVLKIEASKGGGGVGGEGSEEKNRRKK